MTDLLLFARPPQPHFTAVDILALARETTELVAQGADARGVRLDVEGAAPAVQADPRLLRASS